ncbi:MAG: hypothetical protein L3J83_06935 [Proteobacteria bacterium]|nr:hypothetical protein [Pseudomonadota bacterium]
MSFNKISTIVLAIILLSTSSAIASSDGNALVHSREFRGQVYMMDQTHMSLYYYAKDGNEVSNCNGDCTIKWPPALLDADAEMPMSYSLFKREDGTMQIAYKGKPLYRYSKDKKVGDINGDGVGNVWFLMRPE